MDGDITNKGLGRYLTFENMVILAGIIFTASGAFYKLDAVAENQKTHETKHVAEIREVQQEQKTLARDVSRIQTDVEVIKNNQEHFKDRMREQGIANQQILEILQRIEGE